MLKTHGISCYISLGEYLFYFCSVTLITFVHSKVLEFIQRKCLLEFLVILWRGHWCVLGHLAQLAFPSLVTPYYSSKPKRVNCHFDRQYIHSPINVMCNSICIGTGGIMVKAHDIVCVCSLLSLPSGLCTSASVSHSRESPLAIKAII